MGHCQRTTRTSVRQLTIPQMLPGGAFAFWNTHLGCIDEEFGLKLVDVETDTVLLERKKFYVFYSFYSWYRYYLARITGENIRIFDMKFSPDDRYFIAGHADSFAAYDLKDTRRSQGLLAGSRVVQRCRLPLLPRMSLPGIRVTLGPNDVKLVHLSFPSGEKLDEFKVQADGMAFQHRKPLFPPHAPRQPLIPWPLWT